MAKRRLAAEMVREAAAGAPRLSPVLPPPSRLLAAQAASVEYWQKDIAHFDLDKVRNYDNGNGIITGHPVEPIYASMKAAVAQFTACLAVGQGRNHIRVNGIGTDLCQTPQVDYRSGWEEHEGLWPSWAPVGRLGWPEEQARAALFLASDLSSHVTDHNLPVDGGTRAGGGWFFSPRHGRYTNRPTGL